VEFSFGSGPKIFPAAWRHNGARSHSRIHPRGQAVIPTSIWSGSFTTRRTTTTGVAGIWRRQQRCSLRLPAILVTLRTSGGGREVSGYTVRDSRVRHTCSAAASGKIAAKVQWATRSGLPVQMSTTAVGLGVAKGGDPKLLKPPNRWMATTTSSTTQPPQSSAFPSPASKPSLQLNLRHRIKGTLQT
jgi:hypothetical protein